MHREATPATITNAVVLLDLSACTCLACFAASRLQNKKNDFNGKERFSSRRVSCAVHERSICSSISACSFVWLLIATPAVRTEREGGWLDYFQSEDKDQESGLGQPSPQSED